MNNISVVIPLYNKADFVEKTLTSVLNQTTKPHEIIVVNDGSTDNGVEIVSSIDGVILVNQKNGGVSSARNHGISIATGEYIAFLDADDEWHPTFIEEIDRLIKFDSNSPIYGTSFTINKSELGTGENKHEKIDYPTRYNRSGNPFSTSSIVVKRSVFKDIRFPIGVTVGEDIYTWLSIINDFGSPVVSHRKLSFYNQVELSAMAIHKAKPIPFLIEMESQFNKILDIDEIIKHFDIDYVKSNILYGNRIEVLNYIIKRKKSYLLPFIVISIVPKRIIFVLNK